MMPTPTANSGLDLRQLVARNERVFPLYPQVARYFPAGAIEDTRQRLSRAIDRGDGPGLIIGAAGTGKSLLLQVLAAHYHEQFDVVLLACSRLCTRRALLQAILFELGLPYRLRDEGQLRLGLLDHLLSDKECPAGLLLLVDEAQSLSVALLDELRVMTNLVRGGVPRVRIVLAGFASLEELFAQPELESFSQRLAVRSYLSAFNREETSQFIRAQIAACGGAPDLIFNSEAASAVFDATDGIPRLVSQLCDRALLLADERKRATVDRETIQAAWADMQQLPMPWETAIQRAVEKAPSSIVEFGALAAEVPVIVPTIDDVVVEPTELDLDEDAPSSIESVDAAPATVVRAPRSTAVPGDPFAEKFDEEEVVLDNFAAWDEMFNRTTPRVENRRDPQFASLVEAAVEAAPAPTAPATLKLEFEVEEVTEVPSAEAEAEQAEVSAVLESPTDRPPLRLAIVSDPVPLKPIPVLAPSREASTAGRLNPVPNDANVPASWPSELIACLAPKRTRPASNHDIPTNVPRSTADPILIIEDEAPARSAVKPPVRREEYRHLFSRLRSG